MLSEDLFRRLRQDLTPQAGARERIRMRLKAEIRPTYDSSREGLQLLRSVNAILTPTQTSKHLIWERIVASMSTARAHGVLITVRSLLSVPEEAARSLWVRLSPELIPVRRTRGMFWGVKWVAAAVLVLLVAQMTPRLIWTPHTVANSQAMLLPHGDVTVLLDSVWKPVTEEVSLRAGMRVQTGKDGQASITLGDAGVVRLDHATMIDLVDLSNRAEPAGETVPMLSVFSGRVWLQGLVPAHLNGITVFTPLGLVTVYEGSVSIQADQSVQVQVFDRSAQVERDGRTVSILSGEAVTLRDAGLSGVRLLPETAFGTEWVRGNLTLDGVHRKEIAALQQVRLAERARVLPTSALYPVKRAVEAVDLFLTVSEESRMQKKLQYADTRLTEAAALLQSGQTGAVAAPLAEYRSTLVSLASGSDATLAQFLLKQTVAQNASDVSAVLPGDQGYVLKQAVFQTTSELADEVASSGDVQGGLLIDALTTLTRAVDGGNVIALPELWVSVEPQMRILRSPRTSDLKPEVRRQADALLNLLSIALKKQEELGQLQRVDPILLQQIGAYLPAEEATPTLTEEGLLEAVAGIRQRIFLYHQTQPRINQFIAELKQLQGNPDQGRILRRLYFALPGGQENFPERVKQEILKLGWQRATEQ